MYMYMCIGVCKCVLFMYNLTSTYMYIYICTYMYVQQQCSLVCSICIFVYTCEVGFCSASSCLRSHIAMSCQNIYTSKCIRRIPNVFAEVLMNSSNYLWSEKACFYQQMAPEDVSPLERCPHFRWCYVQTLVYWDVTLTRPGAVSTAEVFLHCAEICTHKQKQDSVAVTRVRFIRLVEWCLLNCRTMKGTSLVDIPSGQTVRTHVVYGSAHTVHESAWWVHNRASTWSQCIWPSKRRVKSTSLI